MLDKSYLNWYTKFFPTFSNEILVKGLNIMMNKQELTTNEQYGAIVAADQIIAIDRTLKVISQIDNVIIIQISVN